MFPTRKNRRDSQPSRSKRHLNLESLEGRSMMVATTLALDFTPDGNTTGDFVDTFKYSRYTDGTAPRFLDFNGDRQITNQDVEIAAGQIRNAVGTYFNAPARGYNVTLTHGDVLQDTNFGARYLQYGQQRANEQVLVMYVGGRDTAGVLGRAPIAAAGYNIEGFGRTYTQSIASNLMRNNPNATKEHFVWSVAQTIAHEYGHMFGLSHSRNVYGNDMMNPNQSLTPWTSVFSVRNQYVDTGAIHNSYSELQYSFAGGQGTYFGGSNRGSYLMAGGEEDHDCSKHLQGMIDHLMEDHGHDDHDHHEDHDHEVYGEGFAVNFSDGSSNAAVAFGIGLSTEVVDSLFDDNGPTTADEAMTVRAAAPLKTTSAVAVSLDDLNSRKSRSPLFTAEPATVDSLFAADDLETELASVLKS